MVVEGRREGLLRSEDPAEADGTEDAELRTDSTTHAHRSSRADERLWLEAVHDVAATMRLHTYCKDCGAVRSALPKRGRPLGHFHQALGNLKAILEDHPKYAKLAQVHTRLMTKALEAVPDFGDPYSMPYETQWLLFLQVVQRHRPDLPIDLIEEALPREPRRARPAFVDLISSSSKEAVPKTVRG